MKFPVAVVFHGEQKYSARAGREEERVRDVFVYLHAPSARGTQLEEGARATKASTTP